MRCLALRHVCFEDLGAFAPVLTEFGFVTEYRQAGVTPVSASEWDTADLVIVLGGPISVYEADKYPWLSDEIVGLRSRLAKRMPTIGICLGAQLIASALGARVYAGAAKEIGWSKVDLTESARNSSFSQLEGVSMLHWHGDTFDLPDGATLLASTTCTPHQAFALDDFAMAMQFHPEADGQNFEHWLIGHACELSHAGISVPALRRHTAQFGSRAGEAGNAMFADWLTHIDWS